MEISIQQGTLAVDVTVVCQLQKESGIHISKVLVWYPAQLTAVFRTTVLMVGRAVCDCHGLVVTY